LRRQQYASLGALFGEIYPILGTLALFLAVSRLLSLGGSAQPALSLSGFLAVNAAFGQLFAANTALVRASTTMLGVIPLFDRLRPILAAEPELRPDQTEAGPLSGHIELSHVSFRYAEGSRLVLDDVSLRIEPGQFVAFVGQSGCGKSTLLRLLLGFERPESGDTLYDGQSIGTLDLVSLRRQIGVVLQHSRIATGTIFDNIAGGRPCSLDDVWTAARLAGLDGDIEAMPMGMHTLLIEGSVTLSGGQRQRLMIARALIGKPRLLFFDEATSALDNRTQSVVIQSLERLRTTRVVVAHRLSTLEHADRIFVLAGGQLVESGGFGELIAQHGAFSRLVQRQTL
jgi:ATP-binding cassette subfamily C protein